MTPTERRIAEAAFASAYAHARILRLGAKKAEEAGALMARECVLAVRMSRTTDSDAAPMLAELRRDPVDSALMHAKALADERDRYKALLERAIEAHDRCAEVGAVHSGVVPSEYVLACGARNEVMAAIAKELGR